MLATRVIDSARKGARSLGTLLPRGPGDAVVLSYHLVGAGTGLPVDVDCDVFRRQVLELSARTEIVSLDRAVERLSQSNDGDRPIAVLTFDDAYENFYTHAWPVFCDLGLPATLFVPVGFVEGRSKAPLSGAESLPPVSWPQIREMLASGLLQVGSHSWSHVDLRPLPDDRLSDELAGSQDFLQAKLSVPVTAFCYPKGLWSRRCERAVASVYRLAVVAGGRKLTSSTLNPVRIWRVPIRRDSPATLSPILEAPVWLEEWVADKIRRWWR